MGFLAMWKSERAKDYKVNQMEQNPEVSPVGLQPMTEDSLPELPGMEDPKPETPTEGQPKTDSGKHKNEDPKPDRPKKKVKKASPSPDQEVKANGGEISVSPVNNPDSNNPNSANQLVVYNPNPNSDNQAIVPVVTPPPANRVLPSIGAFTVQCASCFKWRLIPTKEKYEAIRERILQDPFVCERAKEWRPSVSCEDKEDISQDGSRLWAIDKPNIAQPPKGWDRLIHIRGEGSTRFADVYYASPTGKKLRSMVEIEKYLNENPEYKAQGVTLAQFSFQIPRPLQDNYVRKRVPRPPNPSDDSATATPDLSKPLELEDVNPIAWAPPTSGDPLPPVTPSSVDQVEQVKLVSAPVKRKIVVKPPSREKNLSASPARAAPSPARSAPTLAPCSVQSEVQNSSPNGDQI